MTSKKYIVTILVTFLTIITILYSCNYINEDKTKVVLELNNKIEDLQKEVNQYKEDKDFYKQLYINLAKEFGEATNTIILTDTSR